MASALLAQKEIWPALRKRYGRSVPIAVAWFRIPWFERSGAIVPTHTSLADAMYQNMRLGEE